MRLVTSTDRLTVRLPHEIGARSQSGTPEYHTAQSKGALSIFFHQCLTLKMLVYIWLTNWDTTCDMTPAAHAHDTTAAAAAAPVPGPTTADAPAPVPTTAPAAAENPGLVE